MPQQKGAKRAVKVAKRKTRLETQRKEANFKKLARKAEQHDHEHDHDHDHEKEKTAAKPKAKPKKKVAAK